MSLNAEVTPGVTVNKAAVGRAFGRAAAGYDRYSVLQRLTGDRLLAIAGLPGVGHLLDTGCGTGHYSHYFTGRGYRVTAMDISQQMLATARRRKAADSYLRADLDALPFRGGSFDVIWSNLALQWSNNLQQALQQLLTALKPQGSLRFSTLAAGSLPEVDQAWQAIDSSGHVNRFLTIPQIEQAISGSGISLVSEEIRLHFPDALTALWSLKGVGAGHLHQRSHSKPLTRQRLALLDAAWPVDEKGYRLTYQIIYGVKG